MKNIKVMNILVSLDRGDCSRMFHIGEKAWLAEYLGVPIEDIKSYQCLWEEDLISQLDIAYNVVYNV